MILNIKKFAIFIAAIFVLLLTVAVAGGVMTLRVNDAHASGIKYSACDTAGNSGATTTPVYLGITAFAATSTLGPCNLQSSQAFGINWQINASSSASVVNYVVQYSFNGIDWYNQDTNATAHVGTTTNTISPAAAGLSRVSTITTQSGMPLVRVQYAAATASSSVYAQLVANNQVPN